MIHRCRVFITAVAELIIISQLSTDSARDRDYRSGSTNRTLRLAKAFEIVDGQSPVLTD